MQDVHKGAAQPIDILRTYGKVAIKAHAKTNCLTEVMISSAEKWAQDPSAFNAKGPLAGIPVSLKDSIAVGGYDVSVGYSRYTGSPYAADGAMVRLLKDMGAIPYVKTALPITLLSFESTNDLWGRCKNPHNPAYSPGGSTGGEGALLALGGRIGIGSDVAGSVRAPAHFSGIYSLRCATGRWPKMGNNTSMPGQEGIPSVFSPMTRTLNDLKYFTRSMLSSEPWKYDHTVHPIPWRDEEYEAALKKEKLRVGVLETDGVIRPTPAVARALKTSVTSLQKAGHEIVPISDPPQPPFLALKLASLLLIADGTKTFTRPFRTFEWMDPGAKQLRFYMRLPRFVKKVYYWYVKYIKGDEQWAELLKDWHPKTADENWQLVAQREAYKASWHAWWENEKQSFDFILCPPNATPAVPHDGMHDAVSSCLYTFLFNLLDYTTGIVPVTKVDKLIDTVPESINVKKMNGMERGAWGQYDAEKMAGLPVAVQVVGKRLQEEKVLAFMKRLEESLGQYGPGKYEVLKLR